MSAAFATVAVWNNYVFSRKLIIASYNMSGSSKCSISTYFPYHVNVELLWLMQRCVYVLLVNSLKLAQTAITFQGTAVATDGNAAG